MYPSPSDGNNGGLGMKFNGVEFVTFRRVRNNGKSNRD